MFNLCEFSICDNHHKHHHRCHCFAVLFATYYIMDVIHSINRKRSKCFFFLNESIKEKMFGWLENKLIRIGLGNGVNCKMWILRSKSRSNYFGIYSVFESKQSSTDQNLDIFHDSDS